MLVAVIPTITGRLPGTDQFGGLPHGKVGRPRPPKSILQLGDQIKLKPIGDGVHRPDLSPGGRTILVAGNVIRGRLLVDWASAVSDPIIAGRVTVWPNETDRPSVAPAAAGRG